MKWILQKRMNSVVGLNFTGGRLSAFQLACTRGKMETVKSTTADLSVDFLQVKNDPKKGREIRSHLDAAGIRERHCVVAIPESWVMSLSTKVPELSTEDLTSLLQLEAERGFPCDPLQLQIARSVCHEGGVTYVTQLAVRREQIDYLTAILEAAELKPVSFCFGPSVLPGAIPAAGEGRITIAVNPRETMLMVSSGGGITAFRTCETTTGPESMANAANIGVVARQLRITFEQIPVELRGGVRTLKLCGDEPTVRNLAGSLGGWARAAGLTVVHEDKPDRSPGNEMAEGIATRWLKTGSSTLEFLPPRPNRWEVLLARHNSKRLTLSGFVLGGVVVLTLGAFAWQEYCRWSLRSEWGAMQPQVTDLNAVQSLIRDYHPWYDTSFHSLSILRGVTTSFPDNGSVTAKSFEIHGPSGVSVTGTAQDNAALLRTLDQLRKTKEIQDLKVEQIRGKTPLQFTLSFRWSKNYGS